MVRLLLQVFIILRLSFLTKRKKRGKQDIVVIYSLLIDLSIADEIHSVMFLCSLVVIPLITNRSVIILNDGDMCGSFAHFY